jgi:hypothetical protein
MNAINILDFLACMLAVIGSFIDIGLTYIIAKIIRDSGKEDWYMVELMPFNRRIMKKYGLKAWGWISLLLQFVYFTSLYVILILGNEIGLLIRVNYLFCGTYIMVIINNYQAYKKYNGTYNDKKIL